MKKDETGEIITCDECTYHGLQLKHQLETQKLKGCKYED